MVMPTFAAGIRVTGAMLEQMARQIDSLTAPGWTSYAPSWTASSVNPAIGNGSLTGRYRRPSSSDRVECEIKIVMGSTTTFGTGFWILSLPFTASAASVGFSLGTAYMGDTGTLDRSGIARLNSTTQLVLDHATLGVVTGGVPHAWANTDVLIVTFIYEPA